jgi:hypothetical protein
MYLYFEIDIWDRNSGGKRKRKRTCQIVNFLNKKEEEEEENKKKWKKDVIIQTTDTNHLSNKFFHSYSLSHFFIQTQNNHSNIFFKSFLHSFHP